MSPTPGSRGPLILGVTWTFVIIAILIVMLRLYVRRRFSKVIFAEDWIMLLALMFQLAAQSVLTVGYSLYGLGNHDNTIPLSDLLKILELAWIFTTPAILCSIVARISICILMVKIFSAKYAFVWYCYAITSITTITSLAVIIVVWVQCRPVQSLWIPQLKEDGQANCWPPAAQQDLAIAAQALFTFSDLTLVLLPVLIVWKLNMSLSKKLSLIGVLSLGVFTVAASILKTITSQASTATQYNATVSLLWSSLEQSFVIIMGCIPPLVAIRQLEFPTLRSFRSSIRSLIRSDSGSDAATSEGRSNSHPQVYDVGITSDNRIKLPG